MDVINESPSNSSNPGSAKINQPSENTNNNNNKMQHATTAAGVLLLLLLCSTPAVGNDNGLALTPPLGWRSW